MTKADKMFDELGFNKYELDRYIDYLSREKSHAITFRKDIKAIDSNCGIGSEFISMQELKAINEKVKELRWNE